MGTGTARALQAAVWLKQGSHVITDEKLINLFKVLRVVRGMGWCKVHSLSHTAFPLIAF